MELAFPGPAGRLDGLLDEPDSGAPRAAAIVCHPHPLHRGTQRNTIVFRIARALRANGLATLRFNFRGVEGSEGVHDGNGAEEGDAAAALDLLSERHPGLPLWAAGYSFGARTVCALASRDARIQRLVLVALPVARYACAEIDLVTQPGLVVLGGRDPFGTPADLAARHPRLSPRLEIVEIEGADHFFRGRTPILEEAVRVHAERNLARGVRDDRA
jgi:alpha/beta superfamily hydrolase